MRAAIMKGLKPCIGIDHVTCDAFRRRLVRVQEGKIRVE